MTRASKASTSSTDEAGRTSTSSPLSRRVCATCSATSWVDPCLDAYAMRVLGSMPPTVLMVGAELIRAGPRSCARRLRAATDLRWTRLSDHHGMSSTTLDPPLTLGVQLERTRLEHRARRIERVLVV